MLPAPLRLVHPGCAVSLGQVARVCSAGFRLGVLSTLALAEHLGLMLAGRLRPVVLPALPKFLQRHRPLMLRLLDTIPPPTPFSAPPKIRLPSPGMSSSY